MIIRHALLPALLLLLAPATLHGQDERSRTFFDKYVDDASIEVVATKRGTQTARVRIMGYKDYNLAMPECSRDAARAWVAKVRKIATGRMDRRPGENARVTEPLTEHCVNGSVLFARRSEWPRLSLFITDRHSIERVFAPLTSAQLDEILSAIESAAIYAAEMDADG